MSFLTGKAFYTMTGNLDSISFDREEFSEALKRVEQQIKPDYTINLQDYFAGQELFFFYDIFEDFWQNSQRLKNVNFSSVSSCQHRMVPLMLSFRAQEKYRLWFDFICGDIAELPVTFFKHAPYVHPAGESYAFLAVKSGHAQFNSEWILKNLSLFKLDEFHQLTKLFTLKLPYPYYLFAQLNDQQLAWMAQNRKIIATKDFVLLTPFRPFISFWKERTGYLKFFRYETLNEELKDTPFIVSYKSRRDKCLVEQSGLCWKYSLRYYFSYASSTTVFILILSLILLIVVVFIFWQRIKEEKIHESNQRLALQILSHEFRTPITSLVVQNELLMQWRGELPDELEHHLDEISVNIFRLQRLAETSKNYLLASKKGEFNITPRIIENVEDYLFDCIGEFEEQKNIIVKVFTNGCKVVLDPFWFKICVQNLVSNAVKYGVEPIELSADIKGSDFMVQVKDQGECQVSSLNALTKEFYRGSENEGMGLGLSIVKRVMEKMGGSLIFTASPTTFTLIFRRAVKDG